MSHHVGDELAAYAEDQLVSDDRRRVEEHLRACSDCRGELERIRRGIALASSLGPHPMPADVAARIRRRLESAPAGRGAWSRSLRFASPWLRAAAAAVLALTGLVLYWQLNRPWVRLHAAAATPTAFERAGRELHDAIVSGSERLSYMSADEAALWRWLESEDAPVTSMRVDRAPEERARFVPLGATVRTIDGAKTSVLAYRIDGRPVTLSLAPTHDVPDAPAAGWWTKRVMHRRDANGVNTLTWTVGGGTYVMVSELGDAGQRACLICHTSAKFRQRVDQLGNQGSGIS
jgi:anti-sigma factor RsiW